MTIQGATILAAGANRGFGPAFVRETLERSARKTGAVAGRPEVVTLPEGMPVWLGPLEAGACEVVANETSRVTNARLSTEAAFYLALTTV